MNQQRCNEKQAAIENCVRSFIIKSIHAIVQSRNGIVYNTNCVSAVGARNNLMVNVEEDPEIGATIKQTLDAGFPIHFEDVISLEILTAWPNGERMVVEVWQFHFNTASKLDNFANSSKHSLPTGAISNSPRSADENSVEQIAIEDSRQSRLFEKLGTLLKAVIIATRLLPAYRLSRHQDASRYQMCYTLRRGATNLDRLGNDAKCHQVGRLFSGLAIKSSKSKSPNDTEHSPDSLEHIYLSCMVHFRAEPPSFPTSLWRPPAPSWVKRAAAHFAANGDRELRSFAPRFNPNEPGDEERHLPPVRPAFAETECDDPQAEQEDAHPMLLNIRYPPMGWPGECSDEDTGDVLADDDLYESDSDLELDANNLDATHPRNQHSDRLNVDGQVRLGDQTGTPLQLPFSTVGVSGDRLTNLFAELRENANLDLFQVPSKTMSNAGAAQSSLFDGDALSDELERHEKILKEFDDFLAVFCPPDSFLSDV